MSPLEPTRLFICYARHDDAHRRDLELHLSPLRRQGLVQIWSENYLAPGEERRPEIERRLRDAQMILLLVTSRFFGSDSCWNHQMPIALERHTDQAATVFPVIVQPCDWRSAPFAQLKPLPLGGRPVTKWNDQNAAWNDVVSRIRQKVEVLLGIADEKPATPCFLFTFAPNRKGNHAYSRDLAEEEIGIRKALAESEDAGRCEILPVEHDIDPERMIDLFQNPRYINRIAIFHLGGHADSAAPLLEPRTNGATGLADFLGRQRALQLVFLNGCAVASQVDKLLASGVPAVIATSHAIDDSVAQELSTRFYRGLAAGKTLQQAFEASVEKVQASKESPREAYHASLITATNTDLPWPWKLSRSSENPAQWALPTLGKPVSPATRPDPLLLISLPSLCDRALQEARLQTALLKHRRRRPERPLVMLIHGHFREAHERFVDRLQVDLLPSLLKLDPETRPIQRKGPRFFTDPRVGDLEHRCRMLWREVADMVCDNADADREDIFTSITEEHSPVLVELAVNVNNQNPVPETKLMVAWLKELAELKNFSQDCPVVFVLRFSWNDEAEVAPTLAFWRKSAARRVTGLIDVLMNLANAPLGDRLTLIRLPVLESISEADVLSWIEEHVGPVLRDIRDQDSTVLKEDLRERTEKLFEGGGRLPMEKVGRALRRQLQECLGEGGF